MKIDFDMLDELEASGTSARGIIAALRRQEAIYEAQKKPKRAADNARNAAKRGDMMNGSEAIAISGETQRTEANRGESPKPFLRLWAAYPKRKGQNPKRAAQLKFELALKGGADPEAIIAAAGRFSEEARRDGIFGTPYVPQMVKWLNQRCWEDSEEKAEAQEPKFYAQAESPQIEAWDDYLRTTRGRAAPRDAKGGWFFDAEWPPSNPATEAAA